MNLGSPRVYHRSSLLVSSVLKIFSVSEAKAKAEADQMAKKADAFKESREAAMVNLKYFLKYYFN